MELNVHESRRIVSIWMSNAEKNDPAFQSELKAICTSYQAKKYTVAVFHSGDGDLYQSISDLLVHNLKHCTDPTLHREAWSYH